MNKVLIALSLLFIGAFATGCANTLDGAGRDISNVGDKIQKTF